MYRGYRRFGDVEKIIITRSVGPTFPIMLLYTDTSTVVRRNAIGFTGFPDAASRRPRSHVSSMDSLWPNDVPSSPPLRVITDSASSLNLHETSVEVDRHEARSSLSSRSTMVLSPKRRNISPVFDVGCDGWCGYDINSRATVVRAVFAW